MQYLNYDGKNSDECEPAPPTPTLIKTRSREPAFSWLESQKVLLCFSISPHNEGNNKHGCNDVPVQIRSGGRGEGLGGGEVKGDSYLKIHFHKDPCIRAITVKFSFFKCSEML